MTFRSGRGASHGREALADESEDLHMDVREIDNLMIPTRQYDFSSRADIDVSASEASRENKTPVSKQDDNGGSEQPLSEKEQQRRMSRLQDTLKNHNIEISYNDEVNRYSIKVLDSESKEVVKEIPSEKTLEMFARMLEIEGILVDEKR